MAEAVAPVAKVSEAQERHGWRERIQVISLHCIGASKRKYIVLQHCQSSTTMCEPLICDRSPLPSCCGGVDSLTVC